MGAAALQGLELDQRGPPQVEGRVEPHQGVAFDEAYRAGRRGPQDGRPYRERHRHAGGSEGALRRGAAAPLHELSSEPPLLRRDRCRQLRVVVEVPARRRHGVALPARPVLSVDVLVLRLPHQHHPARRPDRRLRRPPQTRDRAGRGAVRGRASGAPRPFRRRHPHRHGPGGIPAPRRGPARPLPLRRGRRACHRDRPADPRARDDRRARPSRRHAREPGRPELRSRGPRRRSAAGRASTSPLRRSSASGPRACAGSIST